MTRGIGIEASEALLDVGVSMPFIKIRIPLRAKPFSIRMTMKRPCLGSQIRISRLYMKLGITHQEMERFNKHEEFIFLAMHGKTISKMVALTVCRGAITGILFASMLAWLIRWFTPNEYLQAANLRFITLIGTKPFMNIIRSAEMSNPMTPRLSQK